MPATVVLAVGIHDFVLLLFSVILYQRKEW